MKIDEYMKKYKLTYKQVYDRIQSGALPAIKKGKEWNITADIEPITRDKPGNQLKDALTAMQIKKLQQGLSDGKHAIIEEFKGDVIADIIECLEELKTILGGMTWDEEQIMQVKNCIDNTMKRLNSV